MYSYRSVTSKTHLTANLATTLIQQNNRAAVVNAVVSLPGAHNLFVLELEQD